MIGRRLTVPSERSVELLAMASQLVQAVAAVVVLQCISASWVGAWAGSAQAEGGDEGKSGQKLQLRRGVVEQDCDVPLAFHRSIHAAEKFLTHIGGLHDQLMHDSNQCWCMTPCACAVWIFSALGLQRWVAWARWLG